MIDEQLVERFHAKWRLDDSGCWLWIASVAGKGYGQIKVPRERRQEYAHRLSYMIHKGEIPAGLQVCHTCDVLRCVNPEHLFLGSSAENHADMKAKGRHLYGDRNTSARLTEKDVRGILAMLAQGLPQTKIAKVYDLAQSSVSRISRKERWAHIK